MAEWYSYFTKFHKGVTKFHKGWYILHFSHKFSLCFPPWWSGLAISQSFTKESQSFTKDCTCNIFILNFLSVFLSGGVVFFLCVFCVIAITQLFHQVPQRSHKVSQRMAHAIFFLLIFFVSFVVFFLSVFCDIFSLCFLWNSFPEIVPPSSTKESQSFTKDGTCNIFLLNFL